MALAPQTPAQLPGASPQARRRPGRRSVLLAALGSWTLGASSTPGDSARTAHAADALAALERRIGGRLGVFVLDTGTGATLAHRADERFAMCSTFKWLLAAQLLSRVEQGRAALDERLPLRQADLLDYAPVAKAQLAQGFMTLQALASAAVIQSDNTCANLLLARLGGPTAFNAYARTLGDEVTRLDRLEPDLNSNEPGDPRDTTTARAMVGTLRAALLGDALAPASRQRLIGWLQACETGHARLRAGLPEAWRPGDKTGTGERRAMNDVAIAFPPGRPPLLIAAYASEATAPRRDVDAAHAEVGRLATAWLR